MKYLKQLTVIFIITFCAEIIKLIIPLPIPSGIYGMLIMFLLLCFKIVKSEQVCDTANFLIGVMGVMFIPAGVGIINNLEIMSSMFGAVIVSVVLITVAVMAVSGKVTDLLIKKEKD